MDKPGIRVRVDVSLRVDLFEEEDGRWSVMLVDIPWCATFGDSREEALAEIKEAAALAIRALPELSDGR